MNAYVLQACRRLSSRADHGAEAPNELMEHPLHVDHALLGLQLIVDLAHILQLNHNSYYVLQYTST